MATVSPEAVVRYFSDDSSAPPQNFFEGSDDELSMEDPESEPDMDDEAPLDDSMDVEESTSTKIFKLAQ